MKYVLDTNVFSKMSGPNCNANIAKWRRTVNDSDLFVTVLTIQEIHKGIGMLRKSGGVEKIAKASAIEAAFDAVLSQFEERVISLGSAAARDWGRRLARQGTKNSNDLGIIAIVATLPGAIAVTRNLIDFRHKGIAVLSPFDDPPMKFHDVET